MIYNNMNLTMLLEFVLVFFTHVSLRAITTFALLLDRVSWVTP